MTDEPRNPENLSEEELAAQRGEPLPDREVMSVISWDPQPQPDSFADRPPGDPGPEPAPVEPGAEEKPPPQPMAGT